MGLSSIALQGLELATTQLDAAASRIAGAGAASANAGGLDLVSLSEEAVALMSAKNLYQANLGTLKTAEQMQKSVLDLMA